MAKNNNTMRILGIETSCDETGLALIETSDKKHVTSNKEPEVKVLANLVRSQVEKHAPHGGVVPSIAKREHAKALPALWKQLLKTQNLEPGTLDLVAVTQGPGLSPCLWQGVEFAKKLAEELEVPLVGVNHLKGHIYTAFPWQTETPGVSVEYPVLSLIVSGGHTELVLSKKPGEFEIIGATRDDAAGEAFDKVARLLDLGFPGGPEISRLAEEGDPEAFDLPRPMINADNYDFSFAGLKTAITYRVKGVPPYNTPLELTQQNKKDLAASFQQAVVDVLVAKTIRAAQEHNPKTIILGGGVAANQLLRKELGEAVKQNLPDSLFLIPDSSLATDNALMIALAAWYERDQLEPYSSAKATGAQGEKTLEAQPNLKISE